MKKGRIVILIVILTALIIPSTIFIINMTEIGFNVEDRYDDSILNSMGVLYDDRSDINAFNEGYSETASCPWGFIHNGIDYFLNNDSVVIAAASGKVESFEFRDNGEEEANRYHIRINIRFNKSTVLGYNFEPWTNKSEDRDHLADLFTVEVGNWVEKGDQIGIFLNIGGGAHIHFDVIEKNDRSCPQKYFGTADYIEIMEMIHSFNPSWELCYV